MSSSVLGSGCPVRGVGHAVAGKLLDIGLEDLAHHQFGKIDGRPFALTCGGAAVCSLNDRD